MDEPLIKRVLGALRNTGRETLADELELWAKNLKKTYEQLSSLRGKQEALTKQLIAAYEDRCEELAGAYQYYVEPNGNGFALFAPDGSLVQWYATRAPAVRICKEYNDGKR